MSVVETGGTRSGVESSETSTTVSSNASSRSRMTSGWHTPRLTRTGTQPPQRCLRQLWAKRTRRLGELRELAHGIYPAILGEAGLGPALATLADEASLPVEIVADVDVSRYPEPIETAAYLTAVEAVDDAASRNAGYAAVGVAEADGSLSISVEDNGMSRNSSMVHAADRVGAVGGTLSVQPTSLRAECPVRVVVADDTMLTRQGLVRLLGEAGVDVVGEAERGGPAASRPLDPSRRGPRRHPDATDIHGRGFGRRSAIRAERPIGVLVLSQYVEPKYAMLLLQDQPERVGYLLKDRVFHIATVVDALRRIMDAETVIDPTIVSLLMRHQRRDNPLSTLTEREREVLALVAEGLTNRAIATRLHVTDRTVEAHITQSPETRTTRVPRRASPGPRRPDLPTHLMAIRFNVG